MLMDNTLVFSNGQKITATAASTNKVDQLAAGDAFAALWLVVDVKEAFTNLTSLTIGIETDDVAAFTGAKELAAVKVAKADLTADANVVKMRLPLGCKRYIRLKYTVTGTAPDAGSVKAFLTPMPPIDVE